MWCDPSLGPGRAGGSMGPSLPFQGTRRALIWALNATRRCWRLLSHYLSLPAFP